MDPPLLAGIILLAFLCEYIDSSLGMGYGTILSPILIITGFDPLLVIPSILISQALSGMSAAYFHKIYKNMTMGWDSKDLRIAVLIIVSGLFAVTFGVLVSVNIPKIMLKAYIGILVLSMGIILLSGYKFLFSWTKILVVGVLSAFNKALSGGGFGPVVTSGQIISGTKTRRAIGITTLAEGPICISSFLAYYLLNGIAENLLPVALTVGALCATPLGPLNTTVLKKKRAMIIVGLLTVSLGAFTLIRTFL